MNLILPIFGPLGLDSDICPVRYPWSRLCMLSELFLCLTLSHWWGCLPRAVCHPAGGLLQGICLWIKCRNCFSNSCQWTLRAMPSRCWLISLLREAIFWDCQEAHLEIMNCANYSALIYCPKTSSTAGVAEMTLTWLFVPLSHYLLFYCFLLFSISPSSVF